MLRGRRAIMLGVLITGLLIGLVGMHHLSVTPDVVGVSAAAMAPSDMDPGPAHPEKEHGSPLLHLCLAMLTAVAVLLVSAAWCRRPGLVSPALRGGVSRTSSTPRAPPATAPSRLALLCVLRT